MTAAAAMKKATRINHHLHHHPIIVQLQHNLLLLVWLLLLYLSSINIVSGGEILHLTAENFHESVEGKSIFISFVSSWCGEACDAMQETWSRLSDDWKDHDIGLVAQVDCSSVHNDENENEDNEEEYFLNPICEEYGIDTFPTVIYGDPASPELYPDNDELTNYNVLSTFCQTTISQPTCSYQRLSYCSDDQRVIIQDLLSKTRTELEIMETHVENLLQQQQEKYEQGLQTINDAYQKLVDEYNKQIETIRQETNYKWLQQILGDMDHKDAIERQAKLEAEEQEF